MPYYYHLLLFPLFVLFASGGYAQETNRLARIECLNPVYNFGTVCNTGRVSNVFILTNNGSATLSITRIHCCCGASAALAQKSIPPGTNTTLNISWSLAGRKGALNKSFYLHSNDPINPIYQLRMIGFAQPSASNAPPVISDAKK